MMRGSFALFGVTLVLAACAASTSVYASDAATIGEQLPGTPVFYAGLNGSKCFRIPTIIKTQSGTLLAFAENRISDCGDNGPHHALVLRRSLDMGKTWGPMIQVVEGTVPCPGCPAAISNPNPVEVTREDGSRAILLAYDTMNNPSTSRHGLDMTIWSDDEGLTWENRTVTSYPPQPNTGALIGPSVGIQAASGEIYFSAVFGSGHFLYWSKDYGKTWAASKTVEHLGECSIAFLKSPEDGEIIMNCRTGSHARAQLTWSKDGIPSEVTFPTGLIDPGCQGSIVSVAGDKGTTLYLSNANTTSSRTHMVIKSSSDGGKTWDHGKPVWSGPSAYSQLVSLKQDTMGLLFEAGKH